MELSSMFGVVSDGWIGNLLIWLVAIAAALLGLVAVANVLDVLFEAEAR